VIEMLNLASLQIDALDGDGAAQTLQDVLALDPQNQRGADMLRELGYELVEEEPANEYPQPAMREPYPSASYDPEAPLPSYDLEEIGPEDVAPQHYSDPAIRASSPMGAPRFDDIDDPFGDAPLPSFPLDNPAPESEASFDLVGQRAGSSGRSDFDETDDPFAMDAPEPPELQTDAGFRLPTNHPASQTTAAGQAPSAPPAVGAELEEALEEADFFVSRGLYEDARTILIEHLARLPNHPLIVERMAELDAQERSVQGGSGTREMPRTPSVRPQLDRAFDIAQSLGEAEGSGDRASGVGAARPSRATEQQIDVEEVFAKFKEGVAKQISVDDAQSHYDLGVAYKEMGLLEDAIREFETAARDSKRECVCESMIGMIEQERGHINEAIEAFQRGLRAKGRTPEQEMVLSFEVAAAYEAKKMNKDALTYYQRVARRDPGYRDVQERIRRLSGGSKSQQLRPAVGADDEFDRAFDDILGGGGKLP
jgi:tetratricopeptide (TPR) repeat protein